MVRLLRKQWGNVALQNGGFQEQLVAFARQQNCLGPARVAQCPPPSNVGKVVKRKKPLDKLAFWTIVLALGCLVTEETVRMLFWFIVRFTDHSNE